MRIKINKDFLTEYKDEFWKGFSFPELVSVGVGLSCAGGVAFVAYKVAGVPPDSGIYLGIPAAAPALAVGFYNYQGYLPLPQLVKEIWYSYQCRQLSFAAMERKQPTGHHFYMQHDACRRSARKRRQKT